MAPGNRNWCFTVNNWTPSDWSALVAAEVRYLCMGQEKGAGGTAHIQGFLVFKNQKSFNAVRAWFASLLGHERAHVEAARGDTLQNLEYTSKEGGVFFEKGDRPLTPKEKGVMEKDRAKRNLDAIMDGRLEDVDSDVVAHHLSKYEYGAMRLKAARRAAVTLDGVLPNLWIYGAAGVGKDMFANEQSAAPYLKDASTKWWCGYQGEADVVLRDVGPSILVDGFKLWTDRYAFNAEVKGGSLGRIRPARMIVTSNYPPSELFRGADVDAVERRFQIVHCHDGIAEFLPRKLIEKPAPLRIVQRPTPPEPASPDRFSSAMSDL